MRRISDGVLIGIGFGLGIGLFLLALNRAYRWQIQKA